jgi:hypothetical protein
VNSLERRARWLLRVYPAAYRRERGDEMIGTLLEATPEGRAWPRLRDARALVIGGLQAHAGQSRQCTTPANLRVAVMVGLALYVSVWASDFAARVIIQAVHGYGFGGYPAWQLAAWSLFSVATVVLAWTAPRISVLTGALAVAAAVAYYLALHADVVVPAVFQGLYLAAVVALGLRGARPSMRWLWLLGVIAAASPVIGLVATAGLFGMPIVLLMPNVLLLPVAVVAIVVMGIDARLILALLTYLVASTALSVSAFTLYGGFAIDWLPYLLVIAVVAAPAIWLLRRQSARPAASSGPPGSRR